MRKVRTGLAAAVLVGSAALGLVAAPTASAAPAVSAKPAIAATSTWTYSSWVKCWFSQLPSAADHWTYVRWRIANTGYRRRIDIFQFGNGNDEHILNYHFWEVNSAAGTGAYGTGQYGGWASPGVLSATFYPTETADPFIDNRIAADIHIHLDRDPRYSGGSAYLTCNVIHAF